MSKACEQPPAHARMFGCTQAPYAHDLEQIPVRASVHITRRTSRRSADGALDVDRRR
jgi:hypothetical protein